MIFDYDNCFDIQIIAISNDNISKLFLQITYMESMNLCLFFTNNCKNSGNSLLYDLASIIRFYDFVHNL